MTDTHTQTDIIIGQTITAASNQYIYSLQFVLWTTGSQVSTEESTVNVGLFRQVTVYHYQPMHYKQAIMKAILRSVTIEVALIYMAVTSLRRIDVVYNRNATYL